MITTFSSKLNHEESDCTQTDLVAVSSLESDGEIPVDRDFLPFPEMGMDFDGIDDFLDQVEITDN